MNVSIDVLLIYRIKANFSVITNYFFISPITLNQSNRWMLHNFLYILKEDISIKVEIFKQWLS